ncbi:antirestriction protein ArdA [Actinosynnema sp. CA-299493]
MERQPSFEGGERPEHESRPEIYKFNPTDRIHLGIIGAMMGDDDLLIDPHTARLIAEVVRTDATPALDLYAETGRVAGSAAYQELMRLRADPAVNEVHTEWLGWLSQYWLGVERQYTEQGELSGGGEREHQYEPQVYVTDLESLERRIYHSLWVDADQPAADIEADIAALLSSSPTVGAKRWAVSAHKDFAGLDMSGFQSAEIISRIARGIREHGAPFAVWVTIAGTEDLNRLDKFSDFYLASYASLEDWVREVAADLEWDKHLDEVIDPQVRKYVAIDYGRFAADAVERWDVVRGHDDRIHVFMR